VVDYRIKVKLDLFVLQFEDVSTHKDIAVGKES